MITTMKRREETRMEEKEEITLAHLRDANHWVNDSFNKIHEEIRATTNNEKEVLKLVKQRIVRDLVDFQSKEGKKKRATSEKIVQVPDTVNVHGNSSRKKSPKRCIESEEEKPRSSKKSKRRNNVDFADLGKKENPEIPEEFKNRILAMNGHDWVFVIEKQLFATDLTTNHNRLSMPVLQVRDGFLREDEKRVLDNKDLIMVRMIEPCLDVTDLNLKKWPMGRSFTYALITKWTEVFQKKKNMLLLGTTVQVWAFRIGLELCFALVVKHGEQDGGASISQSPDIASSSTSSTLPLKEQE